MLKKTITYTNYNDETVTEDFYFNLSKGEVAEAEMSRRGGLTKHLETITTTEDPKEIIATFREIIRMSVGRRSDDGRRFMKNESITSDFMDSGAYDEVLLEVLRDADAGSAFINAIIPKGLKNDSGLVIENTPAPGLPKDSDDRPAWIREDRDPTEEELRHMDKSELVLAMRRKSAAMGSTSNGSDL